MAVRLNPKWLVAREQEIAAYVEAKSNGSELPKIDVTTATNQAIQWLIMRLSKAEIGFKLIQLGAGVKRVTTETDVCPKCNGTGRC